MFKVAKHSMIKKKNVQNNILLYNIHAVTMDNYEPGQDRNVAALSILFMCGGLFL